MNSPAARAIVLGILIAGALAWLHALGVGLPLLLAAGLLLAVVMVAKM